MNHKSQTLISLLAESSGCDTRKLAVEPFKEVWPFLLGADRANSLWLGSSKNILALFGSNKIIFLKIYDWIDEKCHFIFEMQMQYIIDFIVVETKI